MEKRQNDYYATLDSVRSNNNMLGWCKFFLKTLIETTESGRQTFTQIRALEYEMIELVASMAKRSANALHLIRYLYEHPIVDINTVAKELKTSPPTARKLINDLMEKEVLAPYQKQANTQYYVFAKYMKIFENMPVQ